MLVRCVAVALAVALPACDDLKEFRGSHSAQIIGGGFVRSCFAARTELSLQFDPELAVRREEQASEGLLKPPNTITTSDGTFQDTLLEPLRNLPHDPLSELDFPGPQRLRNYLLLARPSSGPLAGRDALVVISLLQSDSIEVRIIARPGDDVTSCPADADPQDGGTPLETSERREYFGLWRMRLH